MSIKHKIPPHIQEIADGYDKKIEDANVQIAYLKNQIAFLESQIQSHQLSKEAYLKYQPASSFYTPINAPLTRDLVRNFLLGYGYPVQTVQLIDFLYRDITDEQKTKLVKTLSVIFNQMAVEGEIEVEKKKGVKGNYYRFIKK